MLIQSILELCGKQVDQLFIIRKNDNIIAIYENEYYAQNMLEILINLEIGKYFGQRTYYIKRQDNETRLYFISHLHITLDYIYDCSFTINCIQL